MYGTGKIVFFFVWLCILLVCKCASKFCLNSDCLHAGHSVVSRDEALARARMLKLDLVEVKFFRSFAMLSENFYM